MRRLELIFGISFALLACRERTRAPEPESLIEDVRIAGCRQIRRGPVCEIETDTQVVLWVQAAPESTLTVEGTEVEWTEVDGGWRTKFEVTTATKSIDVIATRTGRDRYALPVVVWKRPPWLVEADALRTKSATTALAILDAREADADVRTRAEVATMRARIAMFRGEFEESVRLRRRSAELGDEAGVVSKPILDFQSIAYVGIVATRDVDLAREALAEVRRRLSESIGVESAYLEFYEAILAREIGDTRRAIRYLETTERLARELDDTVEYDARLMRADVLSTLGLHRQVEQIYETLEVDELDDACARARLLSNRAWTGLLARLARIVTRFDVSRDAEQALAIYRTTCPNPAIVLNLYVTLALDALESGSLPVARAHVAAAERSHNPRSPEVAAWLETTKAELALRQGDCTAAQRACNELASIGKRVGSPPLEWRAAICRARRAETCEDLDRAEAAYERAERQLDEAVSVPFAGAGLRFDVDAQEAAARRYAEITAGAGRVAAAVAILDRHALRAHRGLERGFRLSALRGEQRRVWERATMRYHDLRRRIDELDSSSWSDASSNAIARERTRSGLDAAAHDALTAALDALGHSPSHAPKKRRPADDELVITIDQLRSDWLVFAETTHASQFVRLPASILDAPDSELAEQLLTPFARLIDTTRRLRVVARGPAHRVDVHRLPWNGVPIGLTHVVTYSADGPIGGGSAVNNNAALVVQDPTADLPAARDEVRRVVHDLVDAGRETITIAGRAVTRRRITEALEGPSLLHWAGHGRTDLAVGFSSALPLAGRASFDVGDILALSGVPNHVVLSGCATAPTDTREIGPARAFILAGASEVVATTRAVRDAEAAAVTGILYRGFDSSLALALQRAQRSAIVQQPESDWAAFRVYVP